MENKKVEFARECSKYAQEKNLPFQMVLALKMSEKKINKAIQDMYELKEKLRHISIKETNHIFHNLNKVGDYRIKKQLNELGLPEIYSRFINEEYILKILWDDDSIKLRNGNLYFYAPDLSTKEYDVYDSITASYEDHLLIVYKDNGFEVFEF